MRIVAALTVVVCCFACRAAETTVPGATATGAASDSAFAAALRTHLEAATQAGQFYGAVLVARDGRTLFEGAYGLADRERAARLGSQTSTGQDRRDNRRAGERRRNRSRRFRRLGPRPNTVDDEAVRAVKRVHAVARDAGDIEDHAGRAVRMSPHADLAHHVGVTLEPNGAIDEAC